MAEIVGQIKCECGRIANVKKQATGSQIHFEHCKACGLGKRSKINSEKVKAAMTPGENSLGEYGSFLKVDDPISEQPANTAESGEVSNLKPDDSNLEINSEIEPETWEPPAASQAAPDAEKSEIGTGLKVGLVVLGVAAAFFGGRAYLNSENIQ